MKNYYIDISLIYGLGVVVFGCCLLFGGRQGWWFLHLVMY